LVKKSVTAGLAGAVSLAAVAAAAGVFSSTAGARGAAPLPTVKIALHGVAAVSISTTTLQSGAVSIVSTFSGKLPRNASPSVGIVRLNPGASIQQAAGAVIRSHGDINALTPYGALVVSAGAPSTVQTTLTPGNYVALNTSGNGPAPGFAPFTVATSSSPAALPAASATETAIEFAFRGPTVLRDGTIVRARNGGYLVHMVTLIGVRDAATGRTVMALLRAGKDKQAQKLAGHNFADLLGPASPGAVQQQVLHTAPGYYIEACFMDTQDHREHTQLGMERLVRVIR
jgi:hypothetical protein